MESNRSSSLFNIAPFQRVEIDIGPNIDRSQGQEFPQFEGDGYYVERSDFPVLISHVHAGLQVENAIPARDGIFVRAPFSGLFLTHPTMNSKGRLSLIIYKSCAEYQNQLSSPLSRLPITMRTITSTGAALTMGVYVPPGARLLRSLNMEITATTLTGASIQSIGYDGSTQQGPTNLQTTIAGVPQTYNVVSHIQNAQVAAPVGGNIILNFTPYQLTTFTGELQIQMVGTGLAGPLAFQGWFE